MERRIFRGSPLYYEEVEKIEFGKKQLDFLSLNLPPICNFGCDFCMVADSLDKNSNPSQIREKELSDVDYDRILAEAAWLGVRHLEISGQGEPTLPIFRNKLRQIITRAEHYGIHTVLFTNGSTLDDGLLDFLNQHNTSLAVSMKYFGQKNFDRSVGRSGAWNKVMKNLQRAKKIMGTKMNQSYRLAVHSAIIKNNLQDNRQTKEWCRENEIFFSVDTSIPQGKLNKDDIDQQAQQNMAEKLTDNSIILANSSRREIGRSVCGTFYYGLGINYDGKILFDAHATDTTELIGNIIKIGLKEAIRRQRWVRNYLYQNGCTNYCPLRDEKYFELMSNINPPWKESTQN